MGDKDYWKNDYFEEWDESSERERKFRSIIEKETGLELEPVGLGAESNEFISGSAEDNGYEKGGADYRVKGTNVYIEITGPLRPVPEGQPLWFRPDKFQNAIKHIDDHDTFMVNHFKNIDIWYVIHFDKNFMNYAITSNKNKTDCKIITPFVKTSGKIEKYVEVQSNGDYIIKGLDYLIDYLKEIKLELEKSGQNEQGQER